MPKYFKLFAVLYLSVALQPLTSAQASGALKESHQSAPPFSVEQLEVTPRLSQKESDLRAAITAHPDSAELLYALALVLRQEAKPKESLEVYTASARLRKPTADELRSVALDYVLLNDFEDAIHWLELASQIEPRNVDVLYALGRCYYSKDRFTDASKTFEKVLTIAPQHLKAEENLGLAYAALNRTEKAEEALKTAAGWANESGTDEWPFFDLGGFLVDQGRMDEALKPLRAAEHINPDNASCHEKLGRALIATRQSAAGVAELEQATRLDPKDPKTHYELGRALRQAGQAERAQREFALSQKLYSAHSQE